MIKGINLAYSLSEQNYQILSTKRFWWCIKLKLITMVLFIRYLLFIPLVCIYYWTCTSKAAKREESELSIANRLLYGLASLQGVYALPNPKLMHNIGNGHLTISTKNEDAQVWFDQGLNHPHGFWYLEAYCAFSEVIMLWAFGGFRYVYRLGDNEQMRKEAIELQNLIKYDEPPRLMYPIEESKAWLHRYRGEKTLMQHAKDAALKRRPKSKMIQLLTKTTLI